MPRGTKRQSDSLQQTGLYRSDDRGRVTPQTNVWPAAQGGFTYYGSEANPSVGGVVNSMNQSRHGLTVQAAAGWRPTACLRGSDKYVVNVPSARLAPRICADALANAYTAEADQTWSVRRINGAPMCDPWIFTSSVRPWLRSAALNRCDSAIWSKIALRSGGMRICGMRARGADAVAIVDDDDCVAPGRSPSLKALEGLRGSARVHRRSKN